MDNSSGGGHGETAAHIILVLEDALFEELVGAGRGLARVNHDLAVVASHLFPVGYFSAEDVFQLPAGEFFHRIGRVYNDSQTKGAIGYVGLAYVSPRIKTLSISYDGEHYATPTVENATNKTYPIVRPLYYYYDAKNKTQIAPLLEFDSPQSNTEFHRSLIFCYSILEKTNFSARVCVLCETLCTLW